MKTSTVSVSAPNWLIVDATGQSLGRLAAQIAIVLRGKHKPSFSPHQLCGDQVIVINASQLNIPAKKLMQKLYYRHSGYLGHLRSKTLGQMMETKPEQVITLAVKRMLPKNRLRDPMLKRLHVFAEAEHPYQAQKPQALLTNAN